MGGMQTVLALLAVVLFSSMTLNSYNNLLRQSDVMEASYINLQAQEIVDRYFEKIECNIFSKNYSPTDVVNNITTIIPASVTPQGGTLTYTFTRRTAALCDKTGDTSNPKSHTVLVSVILTATYGDRQITVGTASNPKTAIFSQSI